MEAISDMTSRSAIRVSEFNLWPAFTDTMLAFVLVLVLMLAYQVGRTIQIAEPGQEQILRDQTRVEDLINALELGSVQVVRDIGRHDLTFGSEALFASGSADLSVPGKELLTALAGSIAGEGLPTLQEIQVGGHTDTVPTSGSGFDDNLELSTARAAQVVRFLTDAGVDPRQVKLSATGYGEFQSVEPNDSEEGRAANRRIEMLILYTKLPS